MNSLTKPFLNLRYFLIIFGFSIVLPGLFSQTQKIKFTKIEGAGGVTFGKINSIAQDKYGFVWLSDQSLRSIFRFDGSEIHQYRYESESENGMHGYYPEHLFFDHDGMLWIAYYGQGIDKFDPYSNTFTSYNNDPEDPSSLINNTVSAVLKDSNGNVWMGSDGGVSLLDEKTGKFKNFIHDPIDPKSLSHNVVRSIYEDKEGSIWIGTGFGFNVNALGGLNKFNKADSSFITYLHDPSDPTSITHNKIRAIFEDSYGNFWIGTGGKFGLHKMNRDEGTFTTIPAFTDVNTTNKNVANWNHITFIKEDAERKLWIGTESNGIMRFDPVSEDIQYFYANNENAVSSGFNDLSGWTACPTDDGLIWLATQQSNLYLVDLNNLQIEERLFPDGSYDVFVDSKGNQWLSTNEGLARLDENFDAIEVYTHDENDPASIDNNEIFAINEDMDGTLWVSTRQGLNKFDYESGSFKSYKIFNNLGNQNTIFYRIYPYRDTLLFLATGATGLYTFNTVTEKFKNYNSIPDNSSTISANNVECIIEFDDGKIYTGHGNGGISVLDVETEKIERKLPGITVECFLKLNEEELWVGTPNGILVKSAEEYLPLTHLYPNLDIQGWIRSMIMDQNENIWVGTGSSIIKIIADKSRKIVLDKSNNVFGDNPQFLKYSSLSIQGWVVMNSSAGLYIIDPDQIKSIDDETTLYFTDFWINDLNQGSMIKPFLEESILNLTTIHLPYASNNIGVKFSITDYRNLENRKIFYTLENFESFWREASPEDPVLYYNIPPGEYLLKIRSNRKSDGALIEKNLVIQIDKPWWQKWWAYLLYLGFGSIIIRFIHEFQKNRILRIEKEKAREKDLQHAEEIKLAYHNLQKTQNQLIHAEKMASLGELTAGIAHEIQNPLNFVNNFSEINNDLIQDLKDAVASNDQEEIKTIIEDLEKNEEKVNHHGRRAESIVKSMLLHSRSTKGEQVPTDINALCDEFLRLSYHGLRAKDRTFNAEFEMDFDESIPKIAVVPQDIGRVLLNLFNNAFQACGEKREWSGERISESLNLSVSQSINPKVIVRTKNIGDKIQISVSDNGPGIPGEIKDKIFQPFFTTKPTGQGTGLGLSLAYDIVKAHGGELGVETKVGEGTVFRVSLPVT